MYLVGFVFNQYLPLGNDHFYCLALTFYILLAAGYFGFGIISHCMVDNAAFQATWHCGGKCV